MQRASSRSAPAAEAKGPTAGWRAWTVSVPDHPASRRTRSRRQDGEGDRVQAPWTGRRKSKVQDGASPGRSLSPEDRVTPSSPDEAAPQGLESVGWPGGRGFHVGPKCHRASSRAWAQRVPIYSLLGMNNGRSWCQSCTHEAQWVRWEKRRFRRTRHFSPST